MITPEEMAALAVKKDNVWVLNFERNIESAAKRGLRCTLLCYTGCSNEQMSAVREIEHRGFGITVRRETIAGVLQHAGYYAEW